MVVAAGAHVRLCEWGRWFSARNLKSGRQGSIVGMPCKITVGGDGVGSIGVRYAGVQVLGLHNQAAREGGMFWAKKFKPSCGGSVFANDVREGSDLCSEGFIGVG